MAGFGDLVQKAFYLGVGIASYAGEKAGDTLKDLRGQAQKLVDELVERGELTAEEAQQLINNMVQQAQQPSGEVGSSAPPGPRRIEILEEDEAAPTPGDEAEALRQQVETLRQQLEDLKRRQS
jgi:polyhydroxyalkanoate synthesis regulator phasin